MRIHLLAQEANRGGGAAVHTAELTRQLAARGHRVSLLCHAAEPSLDAGAAVLRLARHRFGDWPGLWRFAPLLRRCADNLLPAVLPLETPDVLVVSDLPLWRLHRRRFGRVPLVYLPHGLVAPLEVATYPFRSSLQKRLAIADYCRLERWALSEASATLRFTQTGCNAMVNYHGPGVRPRFVVFPAPVPVPPERSAEREPGPLRLLSVGRLVETKNVSLLFRLLPRLIEHDWKLDIVGDGELRSRLEAETKANGLGGRVMFHGHQPDLETFYHRADLFLFPSRLESAGLVLLEAMSHGVPTLSIHANGATYRNANHETVAPRTGFLAKDEAEFAAMLGALLADPSRLRDVGLEARQAVLGKHRWEQYLECVEELLEGIVDFKAGEHSPLNR